MVGELVEPWLATSDQEVVGSWKYRRNETASQNAKHLATCEKNHFMKKRFSLKGSSACEKDYIPFRDVTHLIPPQNPKSPPPSVAGDRVKGKGAAHES